MYKFESYVAPHSCIIYIGCICLRFLYSSIFFIRVRIWVCYDFFVHWSITLFFFVSDINNAFLDFDSSWYLLVIIVLYALLWYFQLHYRLSYWFIMRILLQWTTSFWFWTSIETHRYGGCFLLWLSFKILRVFAPLELDFMFHSFLSLIYSEHICLGFLC